jgi:outer membrane protein assembly complex protein YaeT
MLWGCLRQRAASSRLPCLFVRLWLPLVLGLTCAGSLFADPPQWGQRVTAIRLDCDAHLSLEDLAAHIVQKVGEPLDRAKVRESLKQLFATGRFRELRADTERTDAGVELVFVGRAVFFVGTVRTEGAPKTIEPRALVTATRLRLGQPIEDEELEVARKRLAALLAENGYYQARIEQRWLPDLDTQAASVTFSVVPGEPTRLSAVEFQGMLTVPPEKLAAISGWRPGSQLTSALLERGLFKIRRFYVQRGRLQASVSLINRTHDPQQHTEKLLVRVDPGPSVHVRVRGARISSAQTRELLPIFREGTTDEAAVARGQQNLEDYFEQKAHFSATVKAERVVHPDSQTIEITYSIRLGEPGVFVGYAFSGNRSVPAKELAAALTIHPKDFFRERGIFSRQLLARDASALQALYNSVGFLDARVTSRVNNRHEGQPGRLFVTFEIEEGPQTKVAQLALRGIDAQAQKDLWPSLLSKPGQPYSPTRAEADRESILNYYADRGYPYSVAKWNAVPASSPHEVDLAFEVEPGLQERIQRVVVIGNEHTREGTIRRELTFRRGDPLRQSSILESQRRLYDLGTFSQVQVATENPEGPEAPRTVLVNVEEARRWTLGYGGGIEVQRLAGNQPEGQLRASPRLSFELARLNVGGRAQTFTLRGRLSTLERGGAMNYLIPRFATRRDLNLRLGALIDHSRDVLTFAAEREEASVAVEKHYSPAAWVQGRYSYRRVRVDPDTLRISPEAIPLYSRPARVAMLGLSYANDHRDEPTDATDGSYSLADGGISWRKLGSESNFVRISGQNATYHRLGAHLVFARNTRFAMESTVGQVSPTGEIPLPERFFLGGSESHRGFSINQAGPRDPETGFPVGGNALFLNSLELRTRFAGERLGFVLFHDAGNIFSTIRRMRLLKFTQNSPADLDYTSHVAGLGVRYRTPVGPVRLDVGYNFSPPRYQVINRAVDPAGVLEVRRLSHFQFFLSIGQSF